MTKRRWTAEDKAKIVIESLTANIDGFEYPTHMEEATSRNEYVGLLR